MAGIAGKIGRKHTHSLCLLCGALGLLSVGVIHNKYLLLFSMIGVGIAWASTLAMPYAILAGSLPAGKTGVYMGIFNFFIVLPEIIASLGFGWVMNHLLHNNRLAAVIAGGVFMALAALLMQRVVDPGAERLRKRCRCPAMRSRFSSVRGHDAAVHRGCWFTIADFHCQVTNSMSFPRSSGILLHPTSLPGPHGIGELGGEAHRFADFLKDAGQRIWQVLPLGPTGLRRFSLSVLFGLRRESSAPQLGHAGEAWLPVGR